MKKKKSGSRKKEIAPVKRETAPGSREIPSNKITPIHSVKTPAKREKKREVDPRLVTSPLAILFVTLICFIFILNLTSLFQGISVAKETIPITQPQAFTSAIETDFMENFAGRENYVSLNGALAKPLEQVELNEVIKLHNGYLTTLVEEVSEEDLNMYANHVLGLQEYLAKDDIPFGFVLTPHKMPSDTDMMLPTGYHTYQNRNADALMEKMLNLGIYAIDLREEIINDNLNHYDLFFRTDHHWTVYGGFWSHKYVAKVVDALLGEQHFDEFFYDLDQYDTQVHRNFWLGSQGKRTGEFFAGMDDLPVITPAFETDFHVTMEEKDWDIRGTFAESFLNAERLEVNPYAIYLTSDLETNIVNHKAENETSVFVIKDSFALVMAPFLAMHYDNVYLFDLRLDTCTPKDLVEALEEVDPDVVLCFYNPALIYEKTFAFLPDQLREGTR